MSSLVLASASIAVFASYLALLIGFPQALARDLFGLPFGIWAAMIVVLLNYAIVIVHLVRARR